MDLDPCSAIAITDLPPEVISLIMDFLPLEDTISASITCKKWYYEDSKFWHKHANRIVKVHKLRVIQDLSPAEDLILPGTFEWRPPPLHNFSFEIRVDSVELMRLFWQRFGQQIKRLTLDYCVVSGEPFGDILALCPNLKYLSIKTGAPYFYDTEESQIKSGRENLHFEKLIELELKCETYISDRILNRLAAVAPNLRSLSVSWHTIYERENQANGAKVFTFENLCRVLSILRVQKLSLRYNDLMYENLKDLCESLKGSLLSLELGAVERMFCIECIANAFEDSLQELEISSDFYENSDLLKHLGRLTKLRKLVLKELRQEPLDIATILELKKITKLEHLEVSQITNNNVPAFLEVLSGMKRLKHLCLGSDFLKEKHLFELVKILPPLETLELPDIEVDDAPVVDFVVAAIIYTQHKTLKTLVLPNCSGLKGYGLTGLITDEIMGALENEEEKVVITKAKKSLEFIKSMPKFKDSMQEEGKSYLELEKSTALTHLELSLCDALTDKGLENVFKLHRHLRYLNLNFNLKVTDSTLRLIGKYCTQLEHPVLSQCPITDIGIGYLSNLRRLKIINLSACDLLTDASLEALMKTKSPLRAVYYDGTRITDNAINSFEEWLRL